MQSRQTSPQTRNQYEQNDNSVGQYSSRSNLGSWHNRTRPTRPSRLRRRARRCVVPRSARRRGTSTETCRGRRDPRASTGLSPADRRTATPDTANG